METTGHRTIAYNDSQRDGRAHSSHIESSPDVLLHRTWLESSTPLGPPRIEDFTQGMTSVVSRRNGIRRVLDELFTASHDPSDDNSLARSRID